MPIYEREPSRAYREIDRWEDGVGWLAHPEEAGQRASHAVRCADGIWLLDPLWAPGVDELIDSFLEDRGAEIAGVAVCSAWHARDADRFASQYDVPIAVPAWMGRVESKIDAPVERYDGDIEPSVRVVRYEPFPLWREAIWYVEPHDTLYVADSLGTIDPYVVEDERIGVELACRLLPPRTLREFEPDRILVGHGDGIFEDATRALEYALAGARRRLSKAAVANGPVTVRSMVDALWN